MLSESCSSPCSTDRRVEPPVGPHNSQLSRIDSFPSLERTGLGASLLWKSLRKQRNAVTPSWKAVPPFWDVCTSIPGAKPVSLIRGPSDRKGHKLTDSPVVHWVAISRHPRNRPVGSTPSARVEGIFFLQGGVPNTSTKNAGPAYLFSETERGALRDPPWFPEEETRAIPEMARMSLFSCLCTCTCNGGP